MPLEVREKCELGATTKNQNSPRRHGDAEKDLNQKKTTEDTLRHSPRGQAPEHREEQNHFTTDLR
jgi:hypothetical protein